MIVFPMVGTSRRFREGGYAMPKYMLPLAGRTCFDWSVAGFVDAFPVAGFTFVMRPDFDTPAFVRQRLAAIGLEGARLVVLDDVTAGQAETVERGLDGLDDGDELFVFNIDTFRPGFAPPPRRDRADGYLEVFEGDGDGWSFVEPDDDGVSVRRTTEKVRISDLCCTGLYHFARQDDFRDALAAERRAPSSPELYVAPIYNHLIGAGKDIRYRRVPREEVVFCGVPAEYEALASDDASWRGAFASTQDTGTATATGG